jgi:hypothetical protein
VLLVAVAEAPIITVPPRKEPAVLAKGIGHMHTGTHAAHTHSLEPLDKNRPEHICRLVLEETAPTEDSPRFRHGETVIETHGDAAHALEPLHQCWRTLSECVSLPQLPTGVVAPRVGPAIPAEGKAVGISGSHAPHANPGHGGHRDRLAVGGLRIAVAHC